MVHIRKITAVLALCLMLALLPVTPASAADEGSLWLRQSPSGIGVSVYVCADTAVASGVITISYNATALEFVELVVSDAFVAAHAINDKEAGVIQISWIGTGFVPEEEAFGLMLLEFAGLPDQSAVMTGTVYDASGETIAITTLNMTTLQAAMVQAEALDAEAYTAESFAGVTAALESANELLGKAVVSQTQINEAATKVMVAMEQLEVYVPTPGPTDPTDPTEPTNPSQPTQPTEPTHPIQPTQPTQPNPTDPKPTQQNTQPTPTGQVADPVPKKNDTMLIVLGGLLAVAAVAAVVILKKRGRK